MPNSNSKYGANLYKNALMSKYNVLLLDNVGVASARINKKSAGLGGLRFH